MFTPLRMNSTQINTIRQCMLKHTGIFDMFHDVHKKNRLQHFWTNSNSVSVTEMVSDGKRSINLQIPLNPFAHLYFSA